MDQPCDRVPLLIHRTHRLQDIVTWQCAPSCRTNSRRAALCIIWVALWPSKEEKRIQHQFSGGLKSNHLTAIWHLSLDSIVPLSRVHTDPLAPLFKLDLFFSSKKCEKIGV
jgi:hypothetical protein